MTQRGGDKQRNTSDALRPGPVFTGSAICGKGGDGEFLSKLTLNIAKLGFEARKDYAKVFNFILQNDACSEQGVGYMKSHPEILKMLISGFKIDSIALTCSGILKNVVRHPALVEQLLFSEVAPYAALLQIPNKTHGLLDACHDAAAIKRVHTLGRCVNQRTRSRSRMLRV